MVVLNWFEVMNGELVIKARFADAWRSGAYFVR